MVKIIHRPDPPPEVDSNRHVHRTENVLNKEASARLFEQALVKASGQKQAVEHSKTSLLGQQGQIESKADMVLGAKSRESMLAMRSELSAKDIVSGNGIGNDLDLQATINKQSAELSAAEVAEAEEASDDSIDSIDSDQDELETDLSVSPMGVELSATQQMFENIREANNSAELGQPTEQASGSVNNEQNSTLAAPTSASPSASAATSLESRVSSMSSMSELIDMLETSSPLADGNEWTLILEDDGPVSELTLTSDSDGQWNIGLVTSFDNESVDPEMMDNLRGQLNSAGVAVANIALLDRAPVELSDSKQVNRLDHRAGDLA